MNQNDIGDLISLATEIPGALERLGRENFVSMTARRMLIDSCKIVFIAKNLLLRKDGTAFSFDELKRFISTRLFLTLHDHEQITGDETVEVFVDRQADPMKMSLNNNLGSGRAAYYGGIFNLKGLGKTILATSTDRNHSNGNLDLVSALWEAICTNVISTNLETGAASVFAVINPGNDVEVPWKEGLFPAGIIVRLDRNGELDRPTHLFQKNSPLQENDLLKIAARLGQQDAEKFIERILHGCWSAGNVSTNGHMIDFDTVFAVRHRAPQWSYRPNWLSNFFGCEGEGQKKLLQAMTSHLNNSTKISSRQVCREFNRSRTESLRRRFFDLVGFATPDEAGELISPLEQIQLADEFADLSQKMHGNFAATAPWHEENSSLAIYDFSRFMRIYPVLLRDGAVSGATAMQLLKNPQGCEKSSRIAGMPESLEKKMKKLFMVDSAAKLSEIEERAERFIKIYDNLLQQLKNSCPKKLDRLVQKAWVVNEDRSYMNCRPGNDILVALVQRYKANMISAEQLSQFLEQIISACDRRTVFDELGRCRSDMQIYLNACYFNYINADSSFTPVLALPAHPENNHCISAAVESWQFKVNSQSFACSVETDENNHFISGPGFSLLELLKMANSAASFTFNNEPFRLESICRLDR